MGDMEGDGVDVDRDGGMDGGMDVRGEGIGMGRWMWDRYMYMYFGYVCCYGGDRDV